MPKTDRIEKVVTLKAPIGRVWRALTDPAEFGAWFGVALEAPFVLGRGVHGKFERLPSAEVLADVQRKAGVPVSGVQVPPPEAVFCTVVAMDAPTRFAFRWIPYGIDSAIRDFGAEPTTLVEFTLAETSVGTRLTIVESGFDGVPAERRARAFRMNDGGWAAQAANIQRFVEGDARVAGA